MARGCRPETEDQFFDCLMKAIQNNTAPDDPDGDGGLPTPVPIKRTGFLF
ncbi:hypothetical protein HOB30_01440 [Candidatus Falkowbacteria bacterium]|jgi:hypothetical protein|nr:hypothetical protein [Candidatus Falkowbacteria bacterium]